MPLASVVAIAAPPGGGKSTVARQLASLVTGSCIVTYDERQEVTRMSVAELAAWDKAGGDCNDFELMDLERELERRTASGASLVIFETPFGRSHRGTARFIDHLVWLDTPFDVALARAVGKIIADGARAGSQATSLPQWLASYLATYQQLLWRLYRHQSDSVRQTADLVVSGLEPPRIIAETILRHLRDLGVVSAADGDRGIE